jgi:hypothetical protein
MRTCLSGHPVEAVRGVSLTVRIKAPSFFLQKDYAIASRLDGGSDYTHRGIKLSCPYRQVGSRNRC